MADMSDQPKACPVAHGGTLQGDGTRVVKLNKDATNLLEAAASGNGGVTVSSDGMVKDPETHAEAGYITLKVGTATFQIPFYATA